MLNNKYNSAYYHSSLEDRFFVKLFCTVSIIKIIFFDKLRLNVISNFIASTTEIFLLLLKEYFISSKLKYRWKKNHSILEVLLYPSLFFLLL